MLEFLILLVAGVGLTCIIADSDIFAGLKEKYNKKTAALADAFSDRLGVVGVTDEVSVKFGELTDDEKVVFFEELDNPLLHKQYKMLQLRRKIHYMLNCHQCSGFWVGFLLGMFMHPLHDWSWYWRPLEWVICGGAVSFAASLGSVLINYLNVSYGSTNE